MDLITFLAALESTTNGRFITILIDTDHLDLFITGTCLCFELELVLLAETVKGTLRVLEEETAVSQE